jgi:hypothetical protein
MEGEGGSERRRRRRRRREGTRQTGGQGEFGSSRRSASPPPCRQGTTPFGPHRDADAPSTPAMGATAGAKEVVARQQVESGMKLRVWMMNGHLLRVSTVGDGEETKKLKRET